MAHKAYSTYVISEGFRLYTAVMLPEESGRFPTVVIRSPYADNTPGKQELLQKSEQEEAEYYAASHAKWLAHGYAVVYQHCRGRGRSEGDFEAYVNERADTLALYDWIRAQSFYNGELYLKGASYVTTVHYCAAPFAEDIKGAVFGVQDTERYNICYRNGCFKKGLHGKWHADNYKKLAGLKKNYCLESFETLPLSDFSHTVYGESPKDGFDEILRAPHKDDPFWQTHKGGADARGCTDHLGFPVLFTTGFYDLYTGGIFDMWHSMDAESRARCALVVSPNDHGDNADPAKGFYFPDGQRKVHFGEDHELLWLEHIRHLDQPSPFAGGQVYYNNLFENKWQTVSDFLPTGREMRLTLGTESVTYTYNPYAPTRFKGGLSGSFGGAALQDKPGRYDIVTVYTEPFAEDVAVRGKMTARLQVRADCEDTCFAVRVSIETENGDLGLRQDITTLCYQLTDYVPNTDVTLDFAFDEIAFLAQKGKRLRVDIASADADHYVRHTNRKGLYCEQTTARVAHNTVHLQDSCLILPIA